jgi:hypothetical protein
VLRQKLTSLAFAAPALKASAFPGPAVPDDQPVTVGRLVMLIHKVLTGEYDPRGLTKSLHTREAGHVGADGIMVPLDHELNETSPCGSDCPDIRPPYTA